MSRTAQIDIPEIPIMGSGLRTIPSVPSDFWSPLGGSVVDFDD